MNETDKQILTVGQRAVFTALLQTASITEASKMSGIGRKTIYRYLGQPEFQRVLNKARFEQLSLAIGVLQKSALRASEVLLEILNNKEASDNVRINSARLILENSIKGTELIDLNIRLQILEAIEND